MSLINMRNAMMAGKRLPYDAEVEYLESTGTQWIDTGVLPDFDMIARITLSYQQDSSIPVWGTRGTSYNNRAYTSAHDTNAISTSTFYGGQFDNVSAKIITNIKPAVGQIFEFKLSKDGGWLNGVKVNEWWNTPQPFTPYGTIYLFGRNDPANTKAACRIYHFSLELNGVLVRDFIPVRVGTTGAMYDRRGTGGMNADGSARDDGLYFNRGTGAFLYGNDI